MLLEEKSEMSTKQLHWFRKADFQQLNLYILGFDWFDLYLSQDVDDAINIFYSTVNSFFHACVPLVSLQQATLVKKGANASKK